MLPSGYQKGPGAHIPLWQNSLCPQLIQWEEISHANRDLSPLSIIFRSPQDDLKPNLTWGSVCKCLNILEILKRNWCGRPQCMSDTDNRGFKWRVNIPAKQRGAVAYQLARLYDFLANWVSSLQLRQFWWLLYNFELVCVCVVNLPVTSKK